MDFFSIPLQATWRLLLRWASPPPRAVRSFAGLRFDPMTRRLTSEDGDAELVPQVARLLELLTDRTGEVVTRDEIAKALWGANPPAYPNAGINNAVSKLRVALSDPPDSSRLLRNVPGHGYEFLARVSRERPRPFERFVLAGLVATGALGVWLSLFTQAVAVVAVVYGIFFALVIASLDRLEDTALLRGSVSVVLYIGMAYVPSAWTLFQLVGEVTNLSSLGPAPFYATVMGMKFLPLFALALACWTLCGSERGSLPSRRSFWLAASLCLAMTALGLVAYSGDLTIWRSGIPGARLLASCYGLVVAVNIGFARVAYRTLREPGAVQSRRFLTACALAYVALVIPAVVIGAEYNNVNRHFLDQRRSTVYRAVRPEAAQGLTGDQIRADIGPDLRRLLTDVRFREALRTANFYKVDLDEQFQWKPHAVIFGYAGGQTSDGRTHFRLVRFPREVAEIIGFERVPE